MIKQAEVESLYDCDVLDEHGERIGSVKQIWLDDRDGRPMWASVHTGLFGLKESFVPIQDATLSGRTITVHVEKQLVKGAPRIDVADQHMTAQQEEELFRYYGMIPANRSGHHDRLPGTRPETRAMPIRGQSDERATAGWTAPGVGMPGPAPAGLPDPTGFGTPGPGPTGLGTTGLGTTGLGTTGLGTPGPDPTAALGTTESGRTEPDTTEPGRTGPDTTGLGTTGLDSIGFGATNQGPTDLGSNNPGTTDLGTTDLDTIDLGTTGQDTTGQGTSSQGTADLDTTTAGTAGQRGAPETGTGATIIRYEGNVEISTRDAKAGRVRMVKHVVIEQKAGSAPVLHEDVRVVHEPADGAPTDWTYAGEGELAERQPGPALEQVQPDGRTATGQHRLGGEVRGEHVERDDEHNRRDS